MVRRVDVDSGSTLADLHASGRTANRLRARKILWTPERHGDTCGTCTVFGTAAAERRVPVG